MIDKETLLKNIESFYSSQEYVDIYKDIMAVITDYSMFDFLNGGLYIGFSGGADSVMALIMLKKIAEAHSAPISAVHIEHGIRGDESIKDMEFASSFSESLNIPFFAYHCNVPEYIKTEKISLELGARELRYKAFEVFKNEHNEYKTLVLAHNSTDNLETIIYNLSRGSGTLGMAGIAPKRDNIIRPLIYSSSERIRCALDKFNIPYVVDSTNLSDAYTRNFIRLNIIPLLRTLSANIEIAAGRTSKNLREDAELLASISRDFFDKNYKDGYIDKKALLSLNFSIFSRVLNLMARQADRHTALERVHVNSIKRRLKDTGDFTLDICNGLMFESASGKCRVLYRKNRKLSQQKKLPTIKLENGVNYLEEYETVILVSYDKSDVFSSNVYNFSIQVGIPDDIIDKEVYVRQRNEGDSYTYGGMTRKIKKLFIDRKIPQQRRNNYPIICDNSGILYIPGFSYRGQDGTKTKNKNFVWFSIYFKENPFG